MATRRRGAASLDDLKAKLGYDEATEAEAEPAEGDAPAGPVEEAAGDDDAPAAAPAPASAASPAAVREDDDDPHIDEDYSEAVHDDHHTFRFDVNAVDPELKAPPSKSLMATVIAAAVALVVGLAAGAIGVANNTVRELENATIADAQVVFDIVRPVASQISALDADISSMPADAQFTPAFQTRLTEAYSTGDRPVLDPTLVRDAKTLIVRNDVLGGQLVDYAIATTFLASTVDRHLRATAIDAEEIERLQAGIADEANYAIAIEFETLLSRFQQFVEDPEANPYQPIAAERVTYEDLDMVVEGEGDAQREYYEVTTATGDDINVLIHDLVMLPRDQLLPPVSSENALDRYRNRAAQIKELTASAAAMQTELLAGLEEVANKQTYFTF